MLFDPLFKFNIEPEPRAMLLIAAVFKLEENAVVNPIEILDTPFVPLPFPISKPLIDPVTPNEPVICAEPVNGNEAPPGAQEADVAHDAVPNNEPVNPPAVNCPKIQALVVDELPITVVLDPKPIALSPITISLISPLEDGFVFEPITIELLRLVKLALALLSKAAFGPNTILELPV
jgi:hypothetical protein